MTANERYTFTASGDGTLKAWDNSVESPEGVTMWQSSIGLHSLAIDSARRLLAVVGFDGQFALFNAISLERMYKDSKMDQVQGVWKVAFSPIGSVVAVTTIGNSIYLWDYEKDEQVMEIAPSAQSHHVCYCVQFSQNGELIACGYDDGGLYIFSASTGRLVNSLAGHISPVRALAFSPNGQFLAVGKESKIISLYVSSSGEHIADLSGSEGWIMALDWNQTGEYLLSASFDGRVKIWSIESRDCVCTQTAGASSTSPAALFSACWLHKGWGTGVAAGMNQAFVAVGVERSIRWFREASGQ